MIFERSLPTVDVDGVAAWRRKSSRATSTRRDSRADASALYGRPAWGSTVKSTSASSDRFHRRDRMCRIASVSRDASARLRASMFEHDVDITW